MDGIETEDFMGQGSFVPISGYLDYLKQKSLKAANKVRKSILEEIKDLPNHPEIFPPDKYKLPHNDSYRAFEKYNLRIAYFITETEIRILRIRHTRREPKNY